MPTRKLWAGVVLCVLLVTTLALRWDADRRSTPRPAQARVGSSHADRALAVRSILPAAALAPVSAAVGASDSAYRIARSRAVVHASNPAQQLGVDFARSGVQLSARGIGVGLSLRAAGYGSALEPVGAATLRVSGNRAFYARRALEEWYANGPAGLEQGFTLLRAPSGHPHGVLTLALTLSGSARASIDATGQSIELRGADGSSLRYGELLVTGARGHSLHSWFQLHGRELLIRVDAGGAGYPLRIDPLIDRSALPGTPGGEGDLFGYSVALSGDGTTALVGARYGGGAWVFTRSGSTWEQQGPELKIEEEGAASEQCDSESEATECGFGRSVALSGDGNTALIGAPNDHEDRGAAWVFTRTGTEWSQHGVELTNGEAKPGRFGRSVALSANGEVALVGAPGDHTYHGAAWVFTRTGTEWSQPGVELAGGNEELGTAHFGYSVALSADGESALVGGRFDDGAVGAAWVFTLAGANWEQQGPKLTGAGESGEGRFGTSVALSAAGNTALIGAPTDAGLTGAAWVFTLAGSKWEQQGPKLTGAGESGEGRFGTSVALSGDGHVALIGAPHDDLVGAVWLFARSGTSWEPQGSKLESPGEPSPDDRFGTSVALSSGGATALIGAPAYQDSTGAAWTYLNTSASPPTVSSVAPASGSSEGGTEVVVRGTGFTPGASVAIGGAATAVEVISETELEALTPAHGAGPQEVVVTAAGGESTGGPTYTYVSPPPPPPPTVSSVAPASGSSEGGTEVVVRGTGFTPGSSVAIGGPATAVEVISETELKALTPAHAAGPQEVVVTAAGEDSTDGPTYTYVSPPPPPPPPPRPTVSSVDPASGSSEGGTQVVVTGTGFTPGASVAIGGAATAVEVISETELKALTPAHAAGPEEVVVTDTNGSSTDGPAYTFVAPAATVLPAAIVLPANPLVTSGILSSQVSVPPVPQFALTGNVAPVSGTVLVRLPGSDEFVLLSGLREVPFGTVIDATHGRVTVTTVGPNGKLQTISFYAGEFELTQAHNGRVVAVLTGGNFLVCPTARERSHLARASSSHASGKHPVRKLWAEGHGSYSTKGNYAAGAVVGTVWLTEDLCDGTLIHVATDSVWVTNLVTHHRYRVRAPHSYLAKAP